MTDLKVGTLYIIIYKFDKTRIFTGTFKQFTNQRNDKLNDKLNAEFINVTTHYYSRGIQNQLTFCHYTDYNYYDVYKINNAKKARQNMEKRALDIVLKRLVNEHFEW